MCHSAANVWALFDEDIQNYMGTQANQFMSYEHYDNKTRPKKGFGSIFLRTGAAMKPNVGLASARPDLFGPPLADFMKRAARGLTRIGLFGEQMPLAENRVELVERQGRVRPADRAHHPQLRSGRDRKLGLRARESLRDRQVGKAEGGLARRRAGNVAPDRRHHHGHRRVSNSVTNSYGQTHELANLYIAGAGLFPTEGSVNPTNTIMAVTLRGAEHMAKNFSRSQADVHSRVPGAAQHAVMRC